MSKESPIVTRVLSYLISGVSISAAGLYALYVALFWITSWIGYSKGIATGLTPMFGLVLYRLPAVGLAVSYIGCKTIPAIFSRSANHVVTIVGGVALLGAVVMACLPITAFGR